MPNKEMDERDDLYKIDVFIGCTWQARIWKDPPEQLFHFSWCTNCLWKDSQHRNKNVKITCSLTKLLDESSRFPEETVREEIALTLVEN